MKNFYSFLIIVAVIIIGFAGCGTTPRSDTQTIEPVPDKSMEQKTELVRAEEEQAVAEEIKIQVDAGKGVQAMVKVVAVARKKERLRKVKRIQLMAGEIFIFELRVK